MIIREMSWPGEDGGFLAAAQHPGVTLDSAACARLVNILRADARLYKLLLEKNGVATEDWPALFNALRSKPRLRRLQVRCNALHDRGARLVAHVLRTCPALQFVDLSANQIGDVGAKSLAAAMAEQRHVRQLVLRENDIGSAGASAIADTLSVHAPDCACAALELLDLSRNRIGTESVAPPGGSSGSGDGRGGGRSGGAALAYALAGHPSLHTINLRANPLCAADAAALVHMVTVALSLPSGRCPLRSVVVADGADWRSLTEEPISTSSSNISAECGPLEELRQQLAKLADRDGAWGQERCVRLAAEAERVRRAKEAAAKRESDQRERSWTLQQMEEQGQRR